jgi:predicted Zn-dependent protease
MVSSKNYWVARLGYFLYNKNAGIVLNLAATIGSENFVESKQLLEDAIKRNSRDSALSINYANIINSEGRPDLAVKLLEKVEKEQKDFNHKLSSNLLFISL